MEALLDKTASPSGCRTREWDGDEVIVDEGNKILLWSYCFLRK